MIPPGFLVKKYRCFLNNIVREKFATYPPAVRQQLEAIRRCIFELADKYQLGPVTETLKWNEPSYQVKSGSPVRVDWKPKYPQQYGIYFHCQTKLVDTFRELYSHLFGFEGNRAIIFQVEDTIHWPALSHCLGLALRYHSVKHLPLLGA